MKTRRAAWVAAIVIAITGAGVFVWKKRGSEKPSYRMAKVTRSDVSMNITATGVVQPENRVQIKAPIPGRAEQVLAVEGMKVKKGQILMWTSSTERAALLDAAQARGPEEVKKWEELYRPTPVLAPIHGMIIARAIEPGQTFTINDPVLVMSDRLTIQAQVDETDIAQISLKQQAEVVLDAYATEKVPARVEKIAYEAKTVNNVTTYLVTVVPQSIPAFMRSGMTANVTFVAPPKKDVLVVPATAVRTRDGNPYVLVSAGSEEKPVERSITLGLSDGKKVEVVSGLSEGDTILEPEYKPSGGGKPGATSPFSPLGSSRNRGSGRSGGGPH